MLTRVVKASAFPGHQGTGKGLKPSDCPWLTSGIPKVGGGRGFQMTDALIYFSLFQNKREKLSKIVFCRL